MFASEVKRRNIEGTRFLLDIISYSLLSNKSKSINTSSELYSTLLLMIIPLTSFDILTTLALLACPSQ